MEDISIAHRNLALAHHRLYNDLNNSEIEYRKAIRLNPHDFRYYCDLYEINMQQGKVDQIYDLFLSAPKTIYKQGRFLTRLAILHLINNKTDEAIRILTGNEFNVMEGESNIHDIHITAYLLKGISFLNKNKYEEALKCFHESANYPANQNVGQPEYASFAKINFFIGLTYQLQGNNEKASSFFQKSASETVKPITYMNLVFGTEPEPYSEADFYKILALNALNKTEEKEKLSGDLERYGAGLKDDANGFYINGLINKLKEQNIEGDISFKNCRNIKADHLDCLVAMQLPENLIYEEK
jgi:tetratricopeptide (TPR) repeat protein